MQEGKCKGQLEGEQGGKKQKKQADAQQPGTPAPVSTPHGSAEACTPNTHLLGTESWGK